MTIRETYAKALLAAGAKEVESRSGKYRTFHTGPAVSIGGLNFRIPGEHVFLGKNGAFRVGRVASTSRDASRSTFAKAVLDNARIQPPQAKGLDNTIRL